MLLPLVNVPMIDYTLAWLETAGVDEVFVFCCAHSKQLMDYLDKSQWMRRPNFSVTTIESRNSISAGDALRLIYECNVVVVLFCLFVCFFVELVRSTLAVVGSIKHLTNFFCFLFMFVLNILVWKVDYLNF